MGFALPTYAVRVGRSTAAPVPTAGGGLGPSRTKLPPDGQRVLVIEGGVGETQRLRVVRGWFGEVARLPRTP